MRCFVPPQKIPKIETTDPSMVDAMYDHLCGFPVIPSSSVFVCHPWLVSIISGIKHDYAHLVCYRDSELTNDSRGRDRATYFEIAIRPDIANIS